MIGFHELVKVLLAQRPHHVRACAISQIAQDPSGQGPTNKRFHILSPHVMLQFTSVNGQILEPYASTLAPDILDREGTRRYQIVVVLMKCQAARMLARISS